MRKAMIWIIGVLLTITVLAIIAGNAQLFGFALVLAILMSGLVFEQFRYAGLRSEMPDRRFKPSGERFIDPETGKPVTVYHDPATGERVYVADRSDQ